MADTNKSEGYQRWDNGFMVRRIRLDEEAQVLEWWGALATMSVDLQITLDMRGDDADVDGFYVGELNGEMVASLVETQVADDLRYIGYIYVDKRYRRRGYARRMMTATHDIGRRRNWTRIISLDALEYVESMYEKYDYKTAFRSTSFEGTVPASVSQKRHGTNIIEV